MDTIYATKTFAVPILHIVNVLSGKDTGNVRFNPSLKKTLYLLIYDLQSEDWINTHYMVMAF